MRAHIKHLHHELKTTTIYVTHDQIEAMTLADRVVVMSKAEVQQIGTPEEIYNNPANLFVAGFIGNPSMNLIQGRLQDGAFVAEGMRIEGVSKGSKDHIVMGIRAEDLMLANTDNANVRGDVFSFELTGDATLITLQCGAQRITARSDKEFRAGIGEKLALSAAPERCYLFDGQTQNRLRFDRS
jgi:multiple sugar transport system ATP-binding protein